MRAIICGAGIAGLTLSWWMQRHGWEVLVVERAPALRNEGYMMDFFGSGYDAAELMGILPQLSAVSYDVSDVTNVDERGRPTSHLSFATFRRMQHGRLLSVMRGDLEHVLHAALGDRVELRFGRSIDAVTSARDHVTVTLTDGPREDADLLVGADGIHSRVRELTFGPERAFMRNLGYHTAAYVFTDHALWSRLDGPFRMRAAPGRQAGVYRLRGDRVATFYAHVAGDEAVPDDPRAALQRIYGDMGWLIPEVLAHCPEPPELYYDTVAQIEMPAWSHNRVTLVGDACQAVSLLAGQGASMAMGGAYVLADGLARTSDVPAALIGYEQRVKPAIDRTQAAGRRTADWFVPATAWRIAARDLVLRLAVMPGLAWLLRPILTTATDSIVPSRAATQPA
jgi:2-polyprenyl-6-methoxyphenol hydroxylase-like FAD-dependent oxidoreductase